MQVKRHSITSYLSALLILIAALEIVSRQLPVSNYPNHFVLVAQSQKNIVVLESSEDKEMLETIERLYFRDHPECTHEFPSAKSENWTLQFPVFNSVRRCRTEYALNQTILKLPLPPPKLLS